MVGRRVAIAASVCALACIRCSSFSGSEPTTTSSTTADGGEEGGGVDGAVSDSASSDGGVACVSTVTCSMSSPPNLCDVTTFSEGTAGAWAVSNPGHATPTEGAYTLVAQKPPSPSTLDRTTLADGFRLDIDFEVAFGEFVELVQISRSSGLAFYVDVTATGVTIGAGGAGEILLQSGRVSAKGKLLVDVEPSGISVTLDCGAKAKGPTLNAAAGAPFSIKVGINEPVASGTEVEDNSSVILSRLAFEERP